MLDYRLIVLTHGSRPPLERALRSFAANVTPAPRDAFLFADGAEDAAYAAVASLRGGWNWTLDSSPADAPLGFCGATAECWLAAAESDAEMTFHLEHDFVFERPVDLSELALPLRASPLLAQMALKRQPIGREEVAAGGYVEMWPDEYEERGGLPWASDTWLAHDLHWTTNPSLFRAAFARDHRWPPGPACEGAFGAALRDLGYHFGVWGSRDSAPAVRHIGIRTGHGY